MIELPVKLGFGDVCSKLLLKNKNIRSVGFRALGLDDKGMQSWHICFAWRYCRRTKKLIKIEGFRALGLDDKGTQFAHTIINTVSFTFTSSHLPLFMHLISTLTILCDYNTTYITIHDTRTDERKWNSVHGTCVLLGDAAKEQNNQNWGVSCARTRWQRYALHTQTWHIWFARRYCQRTKTLEMWGFVRLVRNHTHSRTCTYTQTFTSHAHFTLSNATTGAHARTHTRICTKEWPGSIVLMIIFLLLI